MPFEISAGVDGHRGQQGCETLPSQKHRRGVPKLSNRYNWNYRYKWSCFGYRKEQRSWLWNPIRGISSKFKLTMQAEECEPTAR
jgi:hypothetical protein